MIIVDMVSPPIYNQGMRKTAAEDVREIAIDTLDICPNCKSGKLKCRVDVALGYCKPKFKYCDTCGNVKELHRG